MKLTEMEEKCKQIENDRKQREQQLTNLEKLELEAKKKSKEIQMLREIAKIRGEEPPAEAKLNELEKTKQCAETLENEIRKLEGEVYEGMKDITLPIPQEVPKVDSEGHSTIFWEGGPYNYAAKFIALTMNSDLPLELDKTQFHPDKIIVTNVKDPSGVVERLKIFRSNLSRLAKIALQEQDPEIETVVEYLHKSECRELWEAVKGRKRISYEEIYRELNISNAVGKKRVRNFFTNLEQQLKDKFPFMRTDSGIYELSFFGSLVWKRYTDKYAPKSVKSVSKETSSETVVKREEPKVETKKASISSLNKYLSNEDKELIYGREGK